MSISKNAQSSVCFEDFQEELLIYLSKRFGSITFARQVSEETKRRVEEADILSFVGNPRIYLSSYALSLGIDMYQQKYVINPLRRME